MRKFLFVFLTLFSILGTTLPAYCKTDGKEFVGTYTMTDQAGKKWVITLNDDYTVTFKDNKETYYGGWQTYPWDCPFISFGRDDAPILLFPIEEKDDYLWYSVISTDGYLYDSTSSFTSKHPKRRLKLTKIK